VEAALCAAQGRANKPIRIALAKAAALKGNDFSRAARRAKEILGFSPGEKALLSVRIPSAAKAAACLVRFTARLKSCPFKTSETSVVHAVRAIESVMNPDLSASSV
jgi:hypothetical protein